MVRDTQVARRTEWSWSVQPRAPFPRSSGRPRIRVSVSLSVSKCWRNPLALPRDRMAHCKGRTRLKCAPGRGRRPNPTSGFRVGVSFVAGSSGPRPSWEMGVWTVQRAGTSQAAVSSVVVAMNLRPSTAVLLLVVACSGRPAARTDLTGLCVDAAGTSPAPRRDAGPACLALDDAGCPPPPPMDGPPDPATWSCATDADCSVFVDLPFCDGGHCSAAQAAVTCVANAEARGLPSPEVAHTFTGSNGTFANKCDGNGNLIAYQCEITRPPCDPASSAFNGCSFLSLIFTGKVVPYQDSAVIDCVGQCHENRCDGRCPQQGDQVTLVSPGANGNVIINNDTDGRAYSCMPDPASQNGMSFDCARSPAGQTGYVEGRGLFAGDGFCTGRNIGNIGVIVDGPPTSSLRLGSCTYLSCSIVPAASCGP